MLRGATLDLPALEVGDLTNTRPAVLLEAGEVFEAVDVGGSVLSFFLGGSIA